MTPTKDSLPASPSSFPPFEMAEWRIDPALHRLTRNGQTVQVEPRLMHVLVCLASHPGEVITRDTFLETVWPGTIVVEKSLTNAISELRDVLGDDPDAPRYIETIRKTGYRLIVPVRLVRGRESNGAISLPGEMATLAPVGGARMRWLRPALTVVAMLALLAVGRSVWRFASRWTPPAKGAPAALWWGRPLTSDPGFEVQPALSPDGQWVAYAAAGGYGQTYDLFVKPCHAESPLRLTNDPGNELSPAWSPDGATIAFVREGDQATVCTVPAIGGPVRELVTAGTQILGLSWSPDGKWIAYGGEPHPGEYLQIMLVSVETLETHQVNEKSGDYFCAFDPRFSPDGSTIAFTRADVAGLHDIHIVPAAGGTSRRLTHMNCRMYGLDWSADGGSIIFAARPKSECSLWRLSLADGALTWMPPRHQSAIYPTISRAGGRLALEEQAYESDIWRIRVDPGAGRAAAPEQLIASTWADFGASYSPDQRRIAFISMRTGDREIWTCDADGGEPRQMTHLAGLQPTSPHWAPDGKRLAFSAILEGRAAIHVLDCRTERMQCLRPADQHELVCHWSRDGEWIYFDRASGKGWELWRIRPDGRDAARVSPVASNLCGESPDGQWLYYVGDSACGIRRLASQGSGEPECWLEGGILKNWSEVALYDGGLYFAEPWRPGSQVVGRYDPITGRADTLALMPQPVSGMTAVADGSMILMHSFHHHSSDLILIENFQ